MMNFVFFFLLLMLIGCWTVRGGHGRVCAILGRNSEIILITLPSGHFRGGDRIGWPLKIVEKRESGKMRAGCHKDPYGFSLG